MPSGFVFHNIDIKTVSTRYKYPLCVFFYCWYPVNLFPYWPAFLFIYCVIRVFNDVFKTRINHFYSTVFNSEKCECFCRVKNLYSIAFNMYLNYSYIAFNVWLNNNLISFKCILNHTAWSNAYIEFAFRIQYIS